MLDIRFRGKRVDNGEWVYGSLHYEEVECNKQYFKDGANNHYLAVCTRPVIEVEDDSSSELLNDYAVIPKTIGQFTGLKDKNGKEIYGGDRVRCYGGEYYQGYWEHDMVIEIKNMINDCFMMGEHEFLKVIGSIHDNQELLESEG